MQTQLTFFQMVEQILLLSDILSNKTYSLYLDVAAPKEEKSWTKTDAERWRFAGGCPAEWFQRWKKTNLP